MAAILVDLSPDGSKLTSDGLRSRSGSPGTLSRQSTAATELPGILSRQSTAATESEAADKAYGSCFYVPPPPPNVGRIYHNRKKTSYTEYAIEPPSAVKRCALIDLLASEALPSYDRVMKVAFAAGMADEDSSLNEILETPNCHGWPPLLVATNRKQMEAVSALLKLGASVDCEDPESGWTPLMYACADGNNELVQELLANGASVNKFAARHDWNSLCVAIMSNRSDVLDILFQAGADFQLIKKRHPCLAETYIGEVAEWKARSRVAACCCI